MLQSYAVQGPGDSILIGACNALSANGSDDLHAGLVKAYSLADVVFDPDRINRVVLISDGGVQATSADKALIAQHAQDDEGEAIYLMGVGVGDDESPDHYSESLMRSVTDAGKGAYIFIDSAEEASAMFGERLLSNVEIAARDVRIDLILPPTFELEVDDAFAGEPGEPEPQHLSPGDAMIFHLRARSCDTSVLSPEDQVVVRASFDDPITREPGSVELTTNLEELLDQDASPLHKGTAVVAYARALASLQSLEGQAAYDLIDLTRAQIQAVAQALEGDPDLVEIDQLLASYAQLF
jgi:Ca-activated chloride channel family protein